MLQSPPDSHSASWSQVPPVSAEAGVAKARNGSEMAAAAASDLAANLPRDGLFRRWRFSCFTLCQSFPSRIAIGMSVSGQNVPLGAVNRSCTSDCCCVMHWPEFATLQVFNSLSKRYRHLMRDASLNSQYIQRLSK